MPGDNGDTETTSMVGQSQSPEQSHPPPPDGARSHHTAGLSSQPQARHTSHPRTKSQKHVVGGAAGRLHTRVPSSKGKLSKEAAAAVAAVAAATAAASSSTTGPRRPLIQRRVTTEARPSRNTSSSDLQNGLSPTGLKRNSRSQADLSKKRAQTHTNAGKAKSHKTLVRFNLGDDGDDDDDDDEHEDEEEEEWADASDSASPNLSRRTSVANPESRQKNHPAGEPRRAIGPTSASEARQNVALNRSQQNPTSRILQQTPSHAVASLQMSCENVQATPIRTGSPDVVPVFRHGSSTISGTPRTNTTLPSSSREDELSSRFINNATNEGSYVRPNSSSAHEKQGVAAGTANSDPARPPTSVSSLARRGRGDTFPLDDGERDQGGREGTLSQPSRRSAPAESRTQQKLNLQRASSSLEPGPTPGGIGGQSPLIAGSGDTRANKMLERTGMEYLVVRRYQNPIARSISRLGQLPDSERSWRIPPPTRAGTAGSRMSGTLGLGSSFKHPPEPFLGPGPAQKSGSKNARPAETSFEGQEEEFSGTSLVGSHDDTTTALLRSLWDRRLDFASASQ